MSNSAVCASCARRLLLKAQRTHQSQWLRSASTSTSSFVPLNQNHPTQDSPSSHANGHVEQQAVSNSSTRRHRRTRNEPFPIVTTPEDDFLHRLFRGLVTSDQPDLYSRPRIRQSAEEREAERRAKAALFRPPLKRRNPKIYSTSREAAPTQHPAFASNTGEAPPVGYHEVSGSVPARGADRRRGYRLLKSQVGLPAVNGEAQGRITSDMFDGERNMMKKTTNMSRNSPSSPQPRTRGSVSSFAVRNDATTKKDVRYLPEDERELDHAQVRNVASARPAVKDKATTPKDLAREISGPDRTDIAEQWRDWERVMHLTGVPKEHSLPKQHVQQRNQNQRARVRRGAERQGIWRGEKDSVHRLKRPQDRSSGSGTNPIRKAQTKKHPGSTISEAILPTSQESSHLAWTRAVRDQSKSTHELWEAFKKDTTSNTTGKRIWRLPEYAETKMLQRVTASFCEGRDVTPIRPSAAMNDLPVIREYKHVRRALWTVLSFAMRSKSKFPQQLSIPIESLLHEVMALWHILLNLRGTCVIGEDIVHPVPSWAIFQNSNLLQKIISGDIVDTTRGFRERFAKCFQLDPTSRESQDDLDTAALITAALLRAQTEKNGEFARSDYQDFLKFVVDLSSNSNVIDTLPGHIALLDSKLPSQSHRDAAIADLLQLLGASSTPEGIAAAEEKVKAKAQVIKPTADLQNTKLSNIPKLDALDADDFCTSINPSGGSRPAENQNADEEMSMSSLLPSEGLLGKPAASVEGNSSAATGDLSFEETFCRRIGRVIEDKDLRKAERRWQQATMFFGEEIPLEVCRLILTAFMVSRAPKRAVEVWNEMMAKGILPSTGMWNAMLKGCSISKDVQGLDEMWQRMVKSGTALKAEVWGTRIHALARTGQLQAALRAFQQMTRDWVGAAQRRNVNDLCSAGDFEEAPKPTTECLNPLVKSLVREGRYKDMVEVFELSKGMGVKPDSYTFNGLFKAAMSGGNIELAHRLLGMMRSLHINADIATFTMLLDAVFQQPLQTTETDDLRDLAPPSETESKSPFGKVHPTHREALKNIFKEMEASGIPPNERTFSHLVLGLLRSDSKTNIEATYAVIDHMARSGIFVESSIFTNLITHHLLVESPPNVDAAETVWSMALQRTYRRSTLDSVFWDRLIEGFSRAGATRQAMEGIRQCRGQGRIPGWMALAATVKALVSMGDTITAEDLVVEVSGEERMSRNSGLDKLRVSKGKDEFWQTVHEAGLMPVAEFGARGHSDVDAHRAGHVGRSPDWS